MVFLPLILGIILLIFLVTIIKLDTFVSFMLVCLFVGVTGGLTVTDTIDAIEKGIGGTLGSLVIILGFGAMLGKLVAESGAANTITNYLVAKFGISNIQIALIVTGFIVGIPMFYTVGFVILVPLVIAIAANTKLPLLYVGLPMLASLSVTHGFLPPHPAPTAIAEMYGADLGLTLIYGIICGIPAILTAKYLLSRTMRRIQPEYLKEYVPKVETEYSVPGVAVALGVALLPVLLIGGGSLLKIWLGESILTETMGNPAIAMLLAVLAGIYFLGIRTGRSMKDVGKVLIAAVSGVAVVLLIISGAGALKQIMVDTGISSALGESLSGLGMPPLIMAWVIAALIRICLGSATVAGLTAGAIMVPLLGSSDVSPELLVLATGAGSITFSHINDGGFWLFKEYFNVSIKETLLSWSVMETTVSIVGLICVLILNLFI